MKKFFSLIFSLLLLLPLQAQIRQEATSCKSVKKDMILKTTFILDDFSIKTNRQLVLTPVIDDSKGNTAVFKSVVINGRNRHLIYERNGRKEKNYPNSVEVLRKNDTQQAVAYLDTIPYEKWMDEGYLRIVTDTCGCGNLLGRNLGEQRPVMIHPERKLVYAFLPPVAAPDPIVSLSGKAYLDYPVNSTVLDPIYRNNPAELKKILETINRVKDDNRVTITAIGIHGYASPEGSWENNTRLAKGRAATLKEYVKSQYDFPESTFRVEYTPEDWAGLDSLLSRSTLANRDALLRIVRDQSLEPDPRNDKLRADHPEDYRYILNNYYPALRHSDYTVEYRIRPMSDAEAAELLHTQPQLLSLNKMFRIANLYPVGSDAYNEVFDVAVRMYPADPVANVNAANVALKKGDLAAAEKYLAKSGDSVEAIHARGVLALLQQRYADAETFLTQAAQAGLPEAKQNLELLQAVKEHGM